jgi:hypothetical protein
MQIASLVGLIFAVGASPPASAPYLEVVNPTSGQLATLALSNATPGKRARLGWSLAGAGPTQFSTPFGGITLEFGRPFTLTPPLMVDSQGKAAFTRRLPATAAGATIWAQGVVFDFAGIELTNPVVQIIQ